MIDRQTHLQQSFQYFFLTDLKKRDSLFDVCMFLYMFVRDFLAFDWTYFDVVLIYTKTYSFSIKFLKLYITPKNRFVPGIQTSDTLMIVEILNQRPTTAY